MISRVHLSIALLFSKCHLHGSLVIRIINTMESPVHPNNFKGRRQTVQIRSKENKCNHWSPFSFFFYSFSFLCLLLYSCTHPRLRFLTNCTTGTILCKKLFSIAKNKRRCSEGMRVSLHLLPTCDLHCQQDTLQPSSPTHPAPTNSLKTCPWKSSLEDKNHHC